MSTPVSFVRMELVLLTVSLVFSDIAILSEIGSDEECTDRVIFSHEARLIFISFICS